MDDHWMTDWTSKQADTASQPASGPRSVKDELIERLKEKPVIDMDHCIISLRRVLITGRYM